MLKRIFCFNKNQVEVVKKFAFDLSENIGTEVILKKKRMNIYFFISEDVYELILQKAVEVVVQNNGYDGALYKKYINPYEEECIVNGDPKCNGCPDFLNCGQKENLEVIYKFFKFLEDNPHSKCNFNWYDYYGKKVAYENIPIAVLELKPKYLKENGFIEKTAIDYAKKITSEINNYVQFLTSYSSTPRIYFYTPRGEFSNEIHEKILKDLKESGISGGEVGRFYLTKLNGKIIYI